MTNSNRVPNRLITEKSPYLLQHAYNPVQWYPWGEAAFDKARQEDKPIFLSIGYSTCHWCHVMERESFEDEEVAMILNEHFIAIKVDREERPDIDHIYMNVCQALTGHGGWPLTIIMTHEKKPFFAGTYFPKESKSGLSGLTNILNKVAELWIEDPSELLESSEKITEALKPRYNQFVSGDISEDLINKAYKQLVANFDPEHGGFYSAPKFPTPHQYMFLLRYYKRTKEINALKMVEKSLTSMHQGGMYDHIGFGFARYSTDKQWLVPHFEKMLYDNALLAYTYIEAFQATKNSYYARVAEEIFTYVLRDMQDESGGFYSAEDADSEGVEGKFYVWSKEDIKAILGEEEVELFCTAYNITDKGNFEGANIANLIGQSYDYLAKKKGISEDELIIQLESYRNILFKEREKRVHPYKDDKILTAWNGLMIAALAKAAQVLNRSDYSEAAIKSVQFILENLRSKDGRLLARYREGEAAYLAYLDDYAFLIWGLIELYEATFEPYYLEQALELNKEMKSLFWDSINGGYYFYGKDAENLFARPKEVYDGAMPSGNSVAALNLLRLARLTGDSQLEQDAEMQLMAFAGTIGEHPSAYTFFLNAIWFALGPTKEIVIAGEKNNIDTQKILDYLREEYLPEAVVLLHSEDDNKNRIEQIVSYIKEQRKINNKATAYICENFACHSPTTNLEEIKKYLK